LIVLAGDVPPDVAPVAAQLPKILLGRGTTDEWYTAEKAARDLEVLRPAGADVVEHVFDGGHDWHDAFVAHAGGFLDELIRLK
jgi:predicted esterase